MSYSYRTNLVIGLAGGGGEHEPELILRYSVTPGSGDYWDGQQWQQGWAAEVDLETALVVIGDGKVAVPEWLFSYLYSDTDLHAELLSHAADEDEAGRDYAAEHRAALRREDRL